MKQQINLYLPIFRKKRVALSTIAMLQVFALSLALLGAWYGYALYQLQQIEAQQASTLNDLNDMRTRVAKLETKQRDQVPSKLLESEIRRVSDQVDERTQIVDVLSGGSFGNTYGFSKQFEALARQHVDGSWLTIINIGEGGVFVSLKGMTHAPELVPIYLQRLLTEDVFAKVTFNVMVLERSAEQTDQLTFEVATANR